MKKNIVLIIAIFVTTALHSQKYDGIDISHHQGSIDWNKLILDEDIKFVYIKATEGATYIDENCVLYARNAKKHNLKIGLYHFFRMTSSVDEQFKNFKNSIDCLSPSLIPMVDVETTDGYAVTEVRDSLKKFLLLLEKEYKKKPMIYGTQRSYNTICAPVFNNYPLYIGRYGNNKPVVVGPSHYTIWQYSENGVVDGIKKRVDLCKFHPQRNIKDIML